MTESDDIDTNEIYYKSIYSKKSKTLYKIKPPEKKYNETYRGKPADIYLIGLTLFHMV